MMRLTIFVGLLFYINISQVNCNDNVSLQYYEKNEIFKTIDMAKLLNI